MTTDEHASVEVLVIGEALVDIVESADVTTEHPGGSPANVALGLGRRGVDVALLTDLGRDARGRRIVRHLEQSHVRVLDASLSDRPTSTARAVLGADGSAEYRFDVEWRLSADPVPVTPTVVHTGSIAAFLEPGRTGVRAHIDRLQPRILTFDPNIRPALLGTHGETVQSVEEWAARATVVKLSDEDAAWLYPRRSPAEVATDLSRRGPRLVVTTYGARGASLTTADIERHVPAPRTRVADTIGAGDTYMASLIVDMLAHDDRPFDTEALDRIGRRAAHAAAITVSREGADLPWAHDLAELPV